MIEKYDFVRVVDHPIKMMIGAEGIVYQVYDNSNDLKGKKEYNVLFVGKKFNKISEDCGTLIFEENELEGI